MKKLFAVSAALICIASYKVFAGTPALNTPEGHSNSINADYGGVDIATNSFFIGLATVPTENDSRGNGWFNFYASTTSLNGTYSQQRWRVYGVNFSTGNCANLDFVSIQVSSSGATQARELTRIYNNIVVTTGTAVGANVCGGISLLRWPIRAYGNLFWGVNVSNAPTLPAPTYNRADLLYWRESD